MAVIIKDISIPESCRYCCFRFSTDYDNYCEALGGQPITKKGLLLSENYKHHNCPIKSVDILIEGIKSYIGTDCIIDKDTGDYFTPDKDTILKIVDVIKEYCGMEKNNGSDS